MRNRDVNKHLLHFSGFLIYVYMSCFLFGLSELNLFYVVLFMLISNLFLVLVDYMEFYLMEMETGNICIWFE